MSSRRTLFGEHTVYECLSATGTLTNLSVDSLVLRAEYGSTHITVPFASLVTFELDRGKSTKQTAGAWIGGLVGTSLGVFAASRIGHATPEEYVAWSTMLAAFGIGVGAGIGDMLEDYWEDVPLGWVRLAALRRPSGNGMAFGVTVTY